MPVTQMHIGSITSFVRKISVPKTKKKTCFSEMFLICNSMINSKVIKSEPVNVKLMNRHFSNFHCKRVFGFPVCHKSCRHKAGTLSSSTRVATLQVVSNFLIKKLCLHRCTLHHGHPSMIKNISLAAIHY